jgi:hypothetical protein
MSSLQDRVLRAVKLDPQVYEEVEADPEALPQAMIVVILSSVAAGIGSMGSGRQMGIITGTIVALIAWYVWAYFVFFIGTKFLPEPQTQTDHKELLKTIGFASSPGLIRIFGILPFIRGFVFLIAAIWMLVAMIIAVRQALDYTSTGRAVGVCLIGWIVQMIIGLILFSIFKIPAF